MMKRPLLISVTLIAWLLLPLFSCVRAQDDWDDFYEEGQFRKLMQETYQWQEELMRQEALLSELSRQRSELRLKIKALLRSVAQEKAIAEIMLKQQLTDESQVRDIQRLWSKGKRLFDQEKYKEAIETFQKIIELESGQ